MSIFYWLFSLLILIIPTCSFGQAPLPEIPFLNAYNFESGEFKLLLFDVKNNIDSPQYYYSNDINYIEEVQQTLTGHSNVTIYPFFCHETQVLHLCKGDSIIETVSFSANCRNAKTPNGLLYCAFLSPRKMNALKAQTHTFSTTEQATKHIQKIRQDSNLIFISKEFWMHYEGKFGFFYKHKNYDEAFVEKEIQNQLKQQFPKQHFEIFANKSGSSETLFEYHISIYCQKKLFNKFTLGTIDNRQWQPFPIVFSSYWK